MTRRPFWLLAVGAAATVIAAVWPRGAVATVVVCWALAYAGAWRAAVAAAVAIALMTLRLTPPVQPGDHAGASAPDVAHHTRGR